jgi:hypothetical protein
VIVVAGEPLPRAEWIAYRRLLARSGWSIETGISFSDGVARGEADVVSGDDEELIGKRPRTVCDLLEAHRDALPLTGKVHA